MHDLDKDRLIDKLLEYLNDSTQELIALRKDVSDLRKEVAEHKSNPLGLSSVLYPSGPHAIGGKGTGIGPALPGSLILTTQPIRPTFRPTLQGIQYHIDPSTGFLIPINTTESQVSDPTIKELLEALGDTLEPKKV